MDDSDRLVRLAAPSPLVRFGKNAIAAIPILEKWPDCDDRLAQLLAADAICQIDQSQVQKVLPVLVEGLKNGLTMDKSQAAYAIGHLGQAGSPALEALESLMWDECVSIQCAAASVISKITSDPRVEISDCIDLLSAEDWLERYVGAEHLGFMGAVAALALPDLHEAIESDEDEAVRESARLAVEQINQSS